MQYLIIFDIPKGHSILRVKVNRLLKEIDAKLVQNSVWSSDNLKELTKIAIWIRNAGGVAHILEEKIIY
jgi:CRISPR/Cas system-associated endoribonuclease Cas2